MNKTVYVRICTCESTTRFMLACKACEGFLALQGFPQCIMRVAARQA